MIVRRNTRSDVTWEKRPDGKHIVTAGGEILVETSVDTLAKITYEEAVDERDPAKEVRRREQEHFDMQAARSDSFARRTANAQKKGGRGGRGGV